MKFFGPAMRAVAVLFVFSVAVCSAPAAFPQHASQGQVHPPASSHAKKPAASSDSASASSAAATKQLEQVTRSLKQKSPGATYVKLSAFALQKSSGVLGYRAALALGYYDYGKAHYPQAANWLKIAQSDALLRDYALYWSSQTNLALNHNAEALAQLQEFRKDYPDSVITEQVLQSLGVAALAASQPAVILAALDNFPQTAQKPALLFLRAEAREQSAQPLLAAADYQTVYLHFPLSDQAREAGEKLWFLQSSHGDKLAAIPVEQLLEHATTIFTAHQWGDARNEYSHLLPQLSGADRERAQLRIMECGVALGAAISGIAALTIADPDVDAERYYSIANYYRDRPSESQMIAAVESAVARAPDSRWSESALFLAGNYYWVQLDRDRAASYYQRLYANFPTAADALAAQWRLTWAAIRGPCRTSAPLSRFAILARCGVLARPFVRGSRERRAGAHLLREVAAAFPAELFCGRCGEAPARARSWRGSRCGRSREHSCGACRASTRRHYSRRRRNAPTARRRTALDQL
jgi:hypothetical protein